MGRITILGRQIRPTTKNLFESLMMDVWPRHAAIVDFGLNTDRHYAVLQAAVRNGNIPINRLDWALGSGPRLTKLARMAFPEGHPHHDIIFTTAYDTMADNDDTDDPMPPMPQSVLEADEDQENDWSDWVQEAG